jgi:hypothetical protein
MLVRPPTKSRAMSLREPVVVGFEAGSVVGVDDGALVITG